MTADSRPGPPDNGAAQGRLYRQAAEYSAATLHEAAGLAGALPSAIKPLHPSFSICGPALPVVTPPGDNLWIHKAVSQALPGQILVIFTCGSFEAGYWGEILSHAARARGIGGVVLDACARDGARLPEVGVPVFARGLCLAGTSKRPDGHGAVGKPITIGGITIEVGDLVAGDGDGVVVLPAASISRVLTAAQEREEKEVAVVRSVRSRESTTLQLYGLES
jgi:4-hydroxy-4-methyl-2-oxoglutarate aldolase